MRRAALALCLVLSLALFGALAACGGGSSSGGTATPSGGAMETVKGAEMYAEFCAGCHGADGSGGAGGPAVTGQTDVAQVESVVRDGDGSMPGFADEMSEDQITAVAQYLVDRLQ
jgi:mono/diheme cytochrome c family protein